MYKIILALRQSPVQLLLPTTTILSTLANLHSQQSPCSQNSTTHEYTMNWSIQYILHHVIWTHAMATALLALLLLLLPTSSQNSTLRLQTNRFQILHLHQILLPTPLHNLRHKPHHLLPPSLHRLQHLLMIGMLSPRLIKVHHLIRNQTQTQHRHATVMRGQYLRHRRHAHGIGTQHVQHGAFTLTLVLRPAHKGVRSIQMQILIKFQFLRDLHHDILQGHIVQIRRGRKSRSQLLVVWTHQWILPRQQWQCDMIPNDSHIAHTITLLQPPRSIGHQH
mmetsp:Transcript_8468/g.14964  ORF Transcript_8468/g.14964 Transcript_8468/m.14964 type:complete len:278 (-) Transcript_8468:76-909(-)